MSLDHPVSRATRNDHGIPDADHPSLDHPVSRATRNHAHPGHAEGRQLRSSGSASNPQRAFVGINRQRELRSSGSASNPQLDQINGVRRVQLRSSGSASNPQHGQLTALVDTELRSSGSANNPQPEPLTGPPRSGRGVRDASGGGTGEGGIVCRVVCDVIPGGCPLRVSISAGFSRQGPASGWWYECSQVECIAHRKTHPIWGLFGRPMCCYSLQVPITKGQAWRQASRQRRLSARRKHFVS